MGTARRIVIPGGSGYLGSVLARHLSRDCWEVTVLARQPLPHHEGVRFVPWDGRTLGSWVGALDGADAVVNLAGRTVNCRYNQSNRQQIYDSRLESTRVIGQAIAACARPPQVWLNAGSATIYRHAADRPQDEYTGEIGSGFSVDVCRQWEFALWNAPTPTTRKVPQRPRRTVQPECPRAAAQRGVHARAAPRLPYAAGPACQPAHARDRGTAAAHRNRAAAEESARGATPTPRCWLRVPQIGRAHV